MGKLNLRGKNRSNVGKTYGPYIVRRNVGDHPDSEYVIVGCPHCGHETTKHRHLLKQLERLVKCGGCGRRVEQQGKEQLENGVVDGR